MAFRVGVVGHRPDRLPRDHAGRDAIRRRLRDVLEGAKSEVLAFRRHADAGFYHAAAPILRALSPLAEGADRDFAEAAVALGYELCSPMPFPRAEFEKDFADDFTLEADGSPERFHDLIRRASDGPGFSAFELDGSRSDEAQAYGAAGRVVLNQSDLLVAVWDGAEAKGGGGTFDTLREAVDFNIPVIWIDARAPYGWALIGRKEALPSLDAAKPCAPAWIDDGPDNDRRRLVDALRGIVQHELRLPEAGPDTDETDEGPEHAAAYFAERKPALNLGIPWKIFRDFAASFAVAFPAIFVPDFVAAIARSWPTDDSECARGATVSPRAAWINRGLRDHFAWADKLAEFCADAHRSSIVANSLLAALAVLLALLPMAASWEGPLERACIWGELTVLSTIVFTLGYGHIRRWRERWLEYRVLAELIRQLRLMIPLGGGRPLPRTPAHLAIYGDPARSWMYWHVRALAREVGLPDVRADREYIEACLDDVSDMIDGADNGQLGFHVKNHLRSERIHGRLHRGAFVMFIVTILAILLHLLLAHLDVQFPVSSPKELIRWLILVSAVAPAGGAALANINNQGEFARLAKRSLAMAEGFRQFRERIAALRLTSSADRPPPLGKVTEIANQMTTMMVDENVEWRVVVLDLAQSG